MGSETSQRRRRARGSKSREPSGYHRGVEWLSETRMLYTGRSRGLCHVTCEVSSFWAPGEGGPYSREEKSRRCPPVSLATGSTQRCQSKKEHIRKNTTEAGTADIYHRRLFMYCCCICLAGETDADGGGLATVLVLGSTMAMAALRERWASGWWSFV